MDIQIAFINIIIKNELLSVDFSKTLKVLDMAKRTLEASLEEVPISTSLNGFEKVKVLGDVGILVLNIKIIYAEAVPV